MSDDPSDLPTATPGPSPTPTAQPSTTGTELSTNPMADEASTEPIFIGYPGEYPKADAVLSADPPPDFVAFVNIALQARLGQTKWGLISASNKKDLIRKIWLDPSVQQTYAANRNQFSSNVGAVALMENQIQGVMLGQGLDPSVAVDYTNMLQAAGVPLTAGEQAALA